MLIYNIELTSPQYVIKLLSFAFVFAIPLSNLLAMTFRYEQF